MHTRRRLAPPPTVVAGGLAASVGTLLTVAPRSVLLLGATGAIWAAVILPIDTVLVAILSLRNLSDPATTDTAGRAASAGLNTSAAIGLLILALAVLHWWRGRMPTPHAPVIAVGGVLAVLFGLAVVRYGMQASILREAVRFGSIITLGVLAASQARDRYGSERLLMLVLAAATIPATVALMQSIGLAATGDVGQGRARGTLAHPNTAATLFAFCVPLAVWLQLSSRTAVFRRAAVGLVPLFAGALIFTGGIGGLIQAGVSVLVLAALMPLRPRVRVGAVAAAALLAIAFVASPMGASRVAELATTQNPAAIAQSGVPSNSLDWRFYNWSVYLDLWRDRPVLGSGLGTTQELLTPLGGLSTHSDIIRTLVETGVVGLVVLLTAIGALLRKLLRNARAVGDSVAVPALAVMAGALFHTIDSTITEATAPMYTLAVIVGVGAAPVLRTTIRSGGADAV